MVIKWSLKGEKNKRKTSFLHYLKEVSFTEEAKMASL